MMYLSRNWDLSEPSAINRGGHANQGNKTVYEDSDEFERQQERLAEKKRRDEELRMAVVAGAAALQKQQEGGKGKEGEKEKEKEKEQPIDYSLYQTFWGLQEHLADPAGVGKSEEAGGEFVSKAKVVLQAFEGFTVSEESAASAAAKAMGKQKEKEKEEKEKEGQEKDGDEGEGEGEGEKEGGEEEGEGDREGEEKQEEEEEEEPERREEEDDDDDDESKGPAKKRSRKSVAPREGNNNNSTSTSKSNSDTGGANMEAYLGCKYLTNSRLFRLQLHDPLVRVQVLTQLLIFLNHTSASAALAATTTTSPTPTSPAGTSKTTTTTTTNTHTPLSKPGANDLAKHARRLIRSTPPQGNVYLTTLDTVLDREKFWIAWKQLNKCATTIEKKRALPAKTIRTHENVKKALVVAEKSTLTVSQQQKTFYGKALPLPRPVDMKAIEVEVGKMGGESRTFANYIVPRMEEVNDPEACIDEEYHPRHEPVFVWRALRLAAVEETKVLVDLESGGLDGLCGRVMGWPVEGVKEEGGEREGVKKE